MRNNGLPTLTEVNWPPKFLNFLVEILTHHLTWSLVKALGVNWINKLGPCSACTWCFPYSQTNLPIFRSTHSSNTFIMVHGYVHVRWTRRIIGYRRLAWWRDSLNQPQKTSILGKECWILIAWLHFIRDWSNQRLRRCPFCCFLINPNRPHVPELALDYITQHLPSMLDEGVAV